MEGLVKEDFVKYLQDSIDSNEEGLSFQTVGSPMYVSMAVEIRVYKNLLAKINSGEFDGGDLKEPFELGEEY